jgi:N-methylhydantoinase B
VDELPESLEQTTGASEERRPWGHVDLMHGDIQYVRFMGGGGYGDPIDRDPAAVLRDADHGLVSEAAAREIYGVVLADGSIDDIATRARRISIRAERAGHVVPGSAATRAEPPSTGMRLGEYLQRTSGDETQCTWCGAAFAPAGGDWKEHAAVRRSPLSRAGAHRPDTGEFVLIESCCPQCGTLLEAELARGDDQPLHDRVESWPDG